MRRFIYTIALGFGLLALTGAATAITKRVLRPSDPVSLRTVLQRHNVQHDGAVLSSTISEASRFTYYDDGSGTGKQSFFERKVTVSRSRDAFKVFKADPMDVRRQIDASDGNQVSVHTERNQGHAAEEITDLRGPQLDSARFYVRTFGLAPILKEFSDPSSKAEWLGKSKGEDKLRVTTPLGVWTVYLDRTHLIRRIEIGKSTIDYADYREVDGVKLPFFQKLTVADKVVYELVFSRIVLSATFPADYFTGEVVLKDISR